MAIVPYRDLGAKGIILDPNPYQLDPTAWSAGRNVMFHDGKAMSSPIWRSVATLGVVPSFAFSLRSDQDYDTVFLVGNDGLIQSFSGGALTMVTPAGFTPTADSQSVTGCVLGGVAYVNRVATGPYCFLPGATAFTPLPGWGAATMGGDPAETWTCRSLRAFGDYLIALNVTKGGVNQANMFKWSDLALNGQAPSSWDYSNPALSAGENPLERLTTPIVDGGVLKTIFVVYSEDQVWGVVQDGTTEIFDFFPIFTEGGLIAPNAFVEKDGQHFVFGMNDLYVHDGTNKQSLIDELNRQFLFNDINWAQSEVCFTAFLPLYNAILFAYNTVDTSSPFYGCAYCNRGVLYDLKGRFGFVDLPNISSVAFTNTLAPVTWSDALAVSPTLTWASVGGTWDGSGASKRVFAVAGSAAGGTITASRLVAYDWMNKGNLSLPYLAEINALPWIERVGLTLEQVGADLITYKNIRRLLPQVRTFGTPVSVMFGGSLTPQGPITWGPLQTFDPTTQYKLDGLAGGRYLSVHFQMASAADFEIAGFDADVVPEGTL